MDWCLRFLLKLRKGFTVLTERIVYGDIFADNIIVADTSCGAVRTSSNGILLNKYESFNLWLKIAATSFDFGINGLNIRLVDLQASRSFAREHSNREVMG